jgi:hypothetical protein
VLQGQGEQTASHPGRQKYLEQKGSLWTCFVIIVPHIKALFFSTGFDSIQTRHQNIFSTEDGESLLKDMPILPQKDFIQRLQKIPQICTSQIWFLKTLPFITVHRGAQREHLIREPCKNLSPLEEGE